MTKEEAIKIVKSNWPEGRHQIKEALETLIPELAESEDERIRNLIYCIVRDKEDVRGILNANGVSVDNALAYLEKQKEQKRSHIEDIDYKENLDLAKNAVGMIRDGAAYYMMNSKSRQDVLDWIENIPKIIEQLTIKINELEKQKEQKPKFNAGDTIRLKNSYAEYTIESISDGKYYCKGCSIDIDGGNRDYELVQQNPAEWSEEDKKLLDFWLDVIDRNDWRMDENFCKASREFISRLKSLRPQPHWTPSEEQMRVFLKATPVNLMPEELSIYVSLCNDIQKLM